MSSQKQKKESAVLDLVPQEVIEQKIFLIRGQKVMLDKDLAYLYKVKPIALRQQVKRNKKRFQNDFMFQLTKEEADILVSQNVIPSKTESRWISTLCFYGTGCCYAFECFKKRKSYLCKYSNYEDIYKTPRDDSSPC